YGFPVFGVPGFKFGRYHHFEESGEAEYLSREAFREDEEVLRDFAARYFPDGAGPTMILKACLFTNSPDRHFIIDLHPDYPQVSFAAGFSGHGYKFAAVVGEIMADLAERRATRHDVTLFNVTRFTGQMSDLHRNRTEMLERGSWTPAGHSPPHPFYRGMRTGSVPGGALGSPPGQGASHGMRSPHSRQPHRDHRVTSSQYGQAIDTGDPRYWTDDDIKP